MKPKKSLGQNFLINPKVAERIARDAEINPDDIVLEIGPGKGYLTKYLLPLTKKVIAVEKDEHLADELAEKYKKEVEKGKLIILKGDVLEEESMNVLRNFKIVANIPYNITGAILKKFLAGKNKPQSVTLMIQKEVAERILAKNGKESLLSVSVKAYGEPKKLFDVKKGNFFPIPKVDSAVISIKNISRRNFVINNTSEEKFWEVLRLGFAQKRKKLSSNLKKLTSKLEPEARLSLEKELGNKRAENLALIEWIKLVKTLNIHKK